jgi:hypothetical protein
LTIGFFLHWNGHLVVGRPPVVHYLHPPQFVLGIPPPWEDDGPVKGDFAPGAMKENFESSVHQGSNGEEIFDKARKAVSQVHFWG